MLFVWLHWCVSTAGTGFHQKQALKMRSLMTKRMYYNSAYLCAFCFISEVTALRHQYQ